MVGCIMADKITQEDLLIVLRQSAAPAMKLKIEVLDSDKRVMGVLEGGLTGGSVSISGESDIRRTAKLELRPTRREEAKLAEDSLVWLNKDLRISLGLYHANAGQYKYYPLGYYVYTDAAGVRDGAGDTLTVNCSDFMKKLDGTKNGQLGALTVRFPAYEEDGETGQVIRYNTIRDAVIGILRDLAGIRDFRIDDMGEHRGLPEYNDDWQQYREENVTWNAIPYDQEFSSGSSVLSILTTFRDLYPNYEMFFEKETNTFVCQLTPLCYEDELYLDNSFLKRVLISENASVDMTTVRNICEVWGKTIEADFYSEECSLLDNIYCGNVPGYESEYCNQDTIALKIPHTNAANAQIDINGLGAVGIFGEADEEPIKAGELKPGHVYAFRIKKRRVDGQDVIRAYLLGEWQVHAVNVLTDGKKSGRLVTDPEGNSYELYSREYFQKFYNCQRVDMTVVPDSPFTVERLGEILDVKTGGEYESITSDSLAADRASWENRKNCRLTDAVTVTTALLPFLDVNKKVSYQPRDADRVRQYIIRSVSHDFASFTSTITMYRFYPLYEG